MNKTTKNIIGLIVAVILAIGAYIYFADDEPEMENKVDLDMVIERLEALEKYSVKEPIILGEESFTVFQILERMIQAQVAMDGRLQKLENPVEELSEDSPFNP